MVTILERKKFSILESVKTNSLLSSLKKKKKYIVHIHLHVTGETKLISHRKKKEKRKNSLPYKDPSTFL